MMIQPINFYDAKRNKRQRSGHEGPRETNGRKQRTAAVEQHLVYFVRIDGNPLLKIGRSRNFVERIKTYEESSGGTARCEAQGACAGKCGVAGLMEQWERQLVDDTRGRFGVPDDVHPVTILARIRAVEDRTKTTSSAVRLQAYVDEFARGRMVVR